MEDSKKLKGKDLINIGIFTAIYFVVILVFAMLGFIPVFMPLMAVFDPLFGGIVFMLFLTKVKKPGMIFIMSIIMGILMWLTGMSFYALVVGAVTGLIAELIYKGNNYSSSKRAVWTHAVFSLWIWSNFLPLFLQPEKYWSTRQQFGEDYINTLTNLMPIWMCPVLLVVCFVFGILGGLLGKAILKKHFAKAGIV